MEEFVIARNPDEASSLPYLLRLPLASGAVVLKAKDTWPRTSKIYCHPADGWPAPDDLDIVERVSVRSCVRRGVAVDLVLDRGRENRSQFVFTTARGREMVFWQSARTAKQARPSVRVPTARASGHELHVLVDTRERYPWKFADQQATTAKQAIPVGDYAVEADGRVVAVVERKSVDDLVSTIVGGKFWMLLAELAAFTGGEGRSVDGSGKVPGGVAAIVVEDRYSAIFKLRHVRPTSIATQLAEAAVRYPAVPIVFAETRQLAQEWTFRFFGAAVDHVLHVRVG
ncbi:MAG TPA: ERCC4 domain-containing protein, partial [Ilumatobacteraceae bacterium]|nr:ERCC4 domain-containing protein [Ilumatobacteraceae bacterium]